ncbi:MULTISPECIES: hypothetical protein [unclassified Bacillus (in: firmicutes)]|uniref:hypothetical protein n=1 Tax=unclassified Bacillus (in: firmicutes) TaxID=185979 RepID=UPI0008DF6843|nr:MULTISPECIES: hypothetical protein [unclassified Bacillus (in: firmicutes)]SFA91916.1 hypothetical protein SAMN02799634_102615 [Bacillus sp. UNCCL13]SFQ85720.1 hypothetical protein SAMN04488577_2733 [Bacillus sp. cl95]
MDNWNFDDLLNQYRHIWNNRNLIADEKESEEILKEAIKRELLDENSHPRVRKNSFEKYFYAVKRVLSSQLSETNKLKLIELHDLLMDELK